MSYSFTVVGDNKEDVKQKVADAFARVVLSQPVHAADQTAVIACAVAFIDVLTDPGEGQELQVSLSGYLSWNNDVPDKFTSGNVSVAAGIRTKIAD